MKTLNSFLKDNKKMMLVDGDLLAYKVASALEEPTDWGNDQWTLHCDFGVAKQIFAQNLKYYMDKTHAGTYLIVFSDMLNFRKQIDDSYKSYRK